VTSIAIQTDGQIIVAGQGISGYNGVTNNGILRANPDGTLDTSFVSGFGSASVDQIEEVAIQPDGKIVVALDHGNHTYGGANVGNLVRINPDATLDNRV
jgi:flagellar basal body rod protein FlgF